MFRHAILDAASESEVSLFLGNGSMVSEGAFLMCFGGTIHVGERVQIGPHCIIYGHGGVAIGRDTLIAPFVVISSSDHVYWSKGPIQDQGYTREPIRIGEGAWIGSHVVVLAGVTIGDNVVVGAGSVVTHDLPTGYVYAGNPARPIKSVIQGARAADIFGK